MLAYALVATLLISIVRAVDPVIILQGKEIEGATFIGQGTNFQACVNYREFQLANSVVGVWNKDTNQCFYSKAVNIYPSTRIIQRVNNVQTINQYIGYNLQQTPFKSEDAQVVNASEQSQNTFFGPCDVSFLVDGKYQCQVFKKNPSTVLFFKNDNS